MDVHNTHIGGCACVRVCLFMWVWMWGLGVGVCVAVDIRLCTQVCGCWCGLMLLHCKVILVYNNYIYITIYFTCMPRIIVV